MIKLSMEKLGGSGTQICLDLNQNMFTQDHFNIWLNIFFV